MGNDAVELCLARIGQSVCIFALFTPCIVLDIPIVDGKLVDGDHSLVRVESQDQEAVPQQLLCDVIRLCDPPVALRASSPPVV